MDEQVLVGDVHEVLVEPVLVLVETGDLGHAHDGVVLVVGDERQGGGLRTGGEDLKGDAVDGQVVLVGDQLVRLGEDRLAHGDDVLSHPGGGGDQGLAGDLGGRGGHGGCS